MSFSQNERALLLGIKGVGETVIARLEQIGFSSLAQLSKADADDILYQVAALLKSSCWKNSPQARASIEGAINLARRHTKAQ